MESTGLAETSLRRGHGSVQVERLYKKQPAIRRKIWFQTTIVRRFQYPFRRCRLHVSTRVSQPIQEDVFSLIVSPSRWNRIVVWKRGFRSRVSPNVQRARFNNFPLACSYRAQIRFVAPNLRRIGRASSHAIVVLEPFDRNEYEFRDANFCNFVAAFTIFKKRSSTFLTILSGVAGQLLFRYQEF